MRYSAEVVIEIYHWGSDGATFSQLRDLVDEIRIYGGVSDENEFLDRVGIGSILRIEIGDVFIEWVCNAKQTRQSVEDESDRQYWFSVILRDAEPAVGPNSTTIGSTIPIKNYNTRTRPRRSRAGYFVF